MYYLAMALGASRAEVRTDVHRSQYTNTPGLTILLSPQVWTEMAEAFFGDGYGERVATALHALATEALARCTDDGTGAGRQYLRDQLDGEHMWLRHFTNHSNSKILEALLLTCLDGEDAVFKQAMNTLVRAFGPGETTQ